MDDQKKPRPSKASGTQKPVFYVEAFAIEERLRDKLEQKARSENVDRGELIARALRKLLE